MTQPTDLDSLYQLGARNVYDDATAKRIVSDFYELGHWAGPNSIAVAGELRGASTDWLDNVHAVSSIADKEILLSADRNLESVVAAKILKDKDLTRRLLSEQGIPVAKGQIARTAEQAIEFQQEISGPIVIKPRFGSRGRGVSVGLTGETSIKEAFKRAAAVGQVVVEEDVQGVVEYRCLTTPDKCISVVKRILPWVEGDGSSTIDQLIDGKNKVRSTIPSTLRRSIPKDEVTISTLQKQGLELASILAPGQRITVRDVGGLSSGGEPEECFDKVDDRVKAVASASAAAIPGLGWCGSDIMLNANGDPYVIEINTAADTLGASYPFYGPPKAVASLIYEMRYKNVPASITAAPGRPNIVRRDQSGTAEVTAKGSGRSLTSLFHEALVKRGARLEHLDAALTKATFLSGDVRWFSGTASTEALSAVRGAARHHGLVRRLLRRKRVPRVKAIITSRVERHKKFYSESPNGEVWLTRNRGAWGPKVRRTASSVDQLESILSSRRGAWVAQYPTVGKKLIVLASPTEALAVLGQPNVTKGEIHRASDVAVAAVRAIPGLRWGSVDVVIEDSPSGGTSKALVEGVQFDPWIWDSDVLLAGDLRTVFDLIANESSQDASTPPSSREFAELPRSSSILTSTELPDPTVIQDGEENVYPEFRVLLLGDFHFGESYKTGGARVLRRHGYGHALENLWPFIEAADTVVVNLETPLLDPKRITSPYEGEKDYVHWGDPEETIAALKRMKVAAAGLANNHILDYGIEGLKSTIAELEKSGIVSFGAAANVEEARRPFSIKLPEYVGGGAIDIYTAFRWRSGYNAKYDYYATRHNPGVASLSTKSATRIKPSDPDAINIFYPHWGSDYTWVSSQQERVARIIAANGFSLILGHGTHAIQEFELVDNTPVIYGIGNGIFQARGRYKQQGEQTGILPFSFWAMLEVRRTAAGRNTSVLLYPVYSDNRITNFQSSPVSSSDFERILRELATSIDAYKAAGGQMETGNDHLGNFIRIPVGQN